MKNNFDDSIQDFIEILMMEDDAFELVSQAIMQELVRELQDPNSRATMLEGMVGDGAEDLKKAQEAVKELTENLKKEGVSEDRVKFVENFFGLIFATFQDLVIHGRRFVRVFVESCRERGDIPLPKYMSEGDSGMDVYALEEVTIDPGETKLIPTGIKVSIPAGYEIQVRNKSGMALKTKLRVANTPGTIDSSYRGEISVIMENVDPPIKEIDYDFDEEGRPIINSILHGKPFVIDKGQRFAQLVVTQVDLAVITEVDQIDATDSERKEGGFGSTGLN